MKIKGKKLSMCLIVSGIFVLLIAGSLFFTDRVADKGNEATVVEFDGIDLQEEQNGRLIWKLKIENGKVDLEKNITYLTGIDGYFEKNDNRLSITASEGRWDKQTKVIYLEGNIDGKTEDGILLHAENLTYDGKTGTLSTDRPFTFEKDGRVLSADTFTADRVLEKITAQGHAELKDREKES